MKKEVRSSEVDDEIAAIGKKRGLTRQVVLKTLQACFNDEDPEPFDQENAGAEEEEAAVEVNRVETQSGF